MHRAAPSLHGSHPTTMPASDIGTKPGHSGRQALVAGAQGSLVAIAGHADDDDTQTLGVRLTPALFEVLRRWWR